MNIQTKTTFMTKELLALFAKFAKPDTKVDEFINRIKTQNINFAKKNDDYHSLIFIRGEIKNPEDFAAYIPSEDLVDIIHVIIQRYVVVMNGDIPNISEVTEIIRKHQFEIYVVTDKTHTVTEIRFKPTKD